MADQKEVLKETTLTTGEKVTIYKGKGKHLLKAQMRANEPSEIIWHLMAELVEIDGKKIIMEDLLEMELDKVLQLQSIFTEALGVFLSPAQRQLSV